MIFFQLNKKEKVKKTFLRAIKNALVAENDRQKIALKDFLKGIDDENLAKAVKIKKLKSIDEALKLASTVKLSD